MIIIAKVHFPRRHLNQAVTAYTGLPELPPEVLRSGPFFRAVEGTVHALTMYNLPKGEPEEALSTLRERYRCFAAIPEFSCDIQEWREFRESLANWVG